MESTNTISTTKPKRQYKRKAVEIKPVEMPVEVPVQKQDIKPVEVPVETKSVEIPEIKPVEVPVQKQETKKKSKRNIDPNKMTYLKAFKIWREKTGYSGLSPKKNTEQYKEIMSILAEHKQK